MSRSVFSLIGGAVAWGFLTLTASAQNQDPPVTREVSAQLTVRGKITKMEGPDRFVVRTSDNRDVILYANPQTRYVINGRAGKYADLRVNTDVNVIYVAADERHVANSITVGAVANDPPRDPARGTAARAKIVRVKAPDQIVVRTSAGKEVIWYASPQARFVVNGKAGRFADLRAGIEISADVAEREGRHVFTVVTVGPENTEVVPVEGTTIEGTVVRVVGEDQVVVRTPQEKEVIVYVVPQTKYVFDEQPGRFTDLRSGATIRVQYEDRDGRRIGRSIFGLRRNK